jgi:hypothetical protein
LVPVSFLQNYFYVQLTAVCIFSATTFHIFHPLPCTFTKALLFWPLDDLDPLLLREKHAKAKMKTHGFLNLHLLAAGVPVVVLAQTHFRTMFFARQRTTN